MSVKLTEARDKARAALQDTDPDNQIWDDSELDQHILRAKEDIDKIRPREQFSTLYTTAGSKIIDVSSLDDLIDVIKVEYPVDQDPPNYRSVILWADMCQMDIDAIPGSIDPVYVFWTSPHTLTTDDSTLPVLLTSVLIAGAEAYAALAWINQGRSQILQAVAKLTDSDDTLAYIAARITQAVTDLANARSGIGLKLALADSAIAATTARIAQAVTDLASARTYINQLNRGGNPEVSYVQTAHLEVLAAVEYLNQARAYIGEDQPAQEKANLASHELQSANTYVNQARFHVEGITSRLNISSMIASYQKDAMNKLALYRNMLAENEQIRISVAYPTD